MGPDKNSELFVAVAKDIEPIVTEEYLRNTHVVAPTLIELAEQFSKKDNTPNPVTEATLFARLYALSMVQTSRMGIYGFNPLSSYSKGGSVEAKTAPSHDEYVDSTLGAYRTRVIQLVLSGEAVDNINIFGLNFYKSNAEAEEIPTKPTAVSGLILVGENGRPTQKKTPISGETVVFAVHNKETNDAKIYQVTLESAEITAANGDTVKSRIDFTTESSAIVHLPDGRNVIVEQLNGEIQRQAVAELEAALHALRELESPDNVLTAAERQAAQTTAFSTSI